MCEGRARSKFESMPRKPRIDWDAVATAAEHGILKVSELDQLGIPRQTVHHRLSRSERWTRLLPGIAMLSTGVPTVRQQYDAALRYAGPDSMLTGSAACRLHGLDRHQNSRNVHVLIPHDQKRASKEFVEVERTERLPAPETRDGFRVAPLVRALLDAARRMPSLDAVRALLAEAVQRGLTYPHDLTAELAVGSQRGSARCRYVLAEISANVHSTAEAWAYRVLQGSDLPDMWWNVRLLAADGSLLGVPDAWIDEVGLAWQIDSRAYHLSPAAYDNTVRRHTMMTAAGVVVVHTLPSRLRDEPAAVLDELRRAHRVAQQRPRPNVTAVPHIPLG